MGKAAKFELHSYKGEYFPNEKEQPVQAHQIEDELLKKEKELANVIYFQRDRETELEHPKCGSWTCSLCSRSYPNTLLYCPYCGIAKVHSKTLEKKANKTLNKQNIKRSSKK